MQSAYIYSEQRKRRNDKNKPWGLLKQPLSGKFCCWEVIMQNVTLGLKEPSKGQGLQQGQLLRGCVCGTRRSLSPSPGWFREEVLKFLLLPSLRGDSVRGPQSENVSSMHGERMGSALKYTQLYFSSLRSCWCSKLAQQTLEASQLTPATSSKQDVSS